MTKTKKPSSLFISTNPFRPSKASNLSLQPSHFSSRSPLSPPAVSSETARGNVTSSTQHGYENTNKRNRESSSSSSTSTASSSPPCSPYSQPTSAALPPAKPQSSTQPPPSPPPPEKPMPWTWQCHLCYRRYPLAATRRCLEDGHYFCSGMSEIKRSRRGGESTASSSSSKTKKFKRHRPCQSEFDYDGWKAWGEWRRGLDAVAERTVATAAAVAEAIDDANNDKNTHDRSGNLSSRTLVSRRMALQSDGIGIKTFTGITRAKSCSKECDYPSECRWKRQMTARTPELITPDFVAGAAALAASDGVDAAAAAVADAVADNKDYKTLKFETLLPTVFEENAAGSSKVTNKVTKVNTTVVTNMASLLASSKDEPKDDFWKSLLASVSRRKSRDIQEESVDLSDLIANPKDEYMEDIGECEYP